MRALSGLRTAETFSRKDPGFTLIEILITLAIVSAVALALAGTLRIGFTARKKAETALRYAERAAFALEVMRGDLESALSPVGLLAGAFMGEDGKGSEGNEEDILTFHTCSGIEDIEYPGELEAEALTSTLTVGTALARQTTLGNLLRQGRGDVQQVAFYLEVDPITGRKSLIRAVTGNLLSMTEPEPEEQILCRCVRSLNFRYFDPESAQWLDSWDSTQQDNRLPQAVEIALELAPEPAAASSGEWWSYETSERFTRWFYTVVELPCAAQSTEGGMRIVR